MRTASAARYMFVSGAAALVYEILWVRDLGYLFGGSAQALSAVVAAFLAGLALGAFAAGRNIVQRPGLLRLYARLEVAIAVAAPLAPWAIAWLDRTLLDAAWPWLAAHGLATPTRFLLAFALLLPATACMGATLPVLCTAFAATGEATGALIGRLYGWNTLGGVAGCLIAGFVLVEQVGLWRSRFLAAACNVALALLAWRLDARVRAAEPGGAAKRAEAAGAAHAEAVLDAAAPPARGGLPWLAWALLLVASSALSIVLEFGWTRLMALGVGGTSYAFSIVLALYLAGLGLGALLYAALARRAVAPLRALLVAQLVLAALLLGLHPAVDDLLREIGLALHQATSGDAAGSAMAVRGGLALALGGVLVLVPSLLLGIAFPALADLRVARREQLGRGIGTAYLLSTAGGVAASVATHFWLLPRHGLEGTLLAAALGCGMLGALVLAVRARPLALAAAGLVVAALLGAGRFVRERGRWDGRSVYGGVGLYGPRALSPERRLLEARDGASCSVAVFQQRDEVSLAVNGKVDATSRGDMGTQLLLAWLPQLLARGEHEVFVLGYGAGVTAAAAARYGARVVCAEIEPEVLAVSARFADVNRDAHADPRIELVADDGRALLRRAGRRFDVITTEPSNPWLAGMAALFTVEFYELCKERLAPGGVVCQWVQLYWSSPDDYQAIFATLGSVFPHVAIWRTTSGDTLMLGSEQPLEPDPAQLAGRAALRPWLADELARSGATGRDLRVQLAPMALLAGEDARRFADGGARRIRDDVPFLEFTAARHMQAQSADAILERVFAHRATPLYHRTLLAGTLPPAEFAATLVATAGQALLYGAHALAEPLLEEAQRLAPAHERLPFWRWLAARKAGAAEEAARRLADLERRTPGLLLQVAEEHARAREFVPALAALDRLDARVGATGASAYQRGRVRELEGRRTEAADLYAEALELEPRLSAARDALRRLREGR